MIQTAFTTALILSPNVHRHNNFNGYIFISISTLFQIYMVPSVFVVNTFWTLVINVALCFLKWDFMWSIWLNQLVDNGLLMSNWTSHFFSVIVFKFQILKSKGHFIFYSIFKFFVLTKVYYFVMLWCQMGSLCILLLIV